MPVVRISLLFAWALMPLCGIANGVELDFDRYREYATWSQGEHALIADLADRSLDQHSTLEAALSAAGTSRQRIAELQKVMRESSSRCRAKLGSERSTRRRLQVVFQHLSDEFLTGEYRAELYDSGRTLAKGDFNCLTATILFQALCRANSIEVEAAWQPAHVRCWVPVAGGTGYLVETTASSPRNAIGPLSLQQDHSHRLLSDAELVGKVYYNRGVSTMKTGAYPTALISTWAGCLIDPRDQPAHSNLRACLNNWALAAYQNKDLPLARQLLEEGIRLDPSYEPFLKNREILSAQSASRNR